MKNEFSKFQTKAENQFFVLIVDDDEASINFLHNVLTENGYAVRPTTNPHFALQSAFQKPPDIILLDIKMPELDGFGLCQKLKEDSRTKGIPIIFISALEQIEDKIKAFKLGGVDYITKPFNEAEVLSRIQTHIKLYQLKTQLENLVQKRTEEKQELENHIRQVQKLLKAQRIGKTGFIDYNIKTGLVYFSDEIYNLYGIDSQVKLTKDFVMSLVHPDDLAYVKKFLNLAINNKKEYNIDHRVVRVDNGHIIWINAHGEMRFDTDGNPESISVAVVDITERKQNSIRIELLNRLNEELLISDSLTTKLNLITDSIIKIFNADFARIWLIKAGDLCDSNCHHAKVLEGPHVCRYRERCLHLISSSGRYTHIDGAHGRVPFDCYKIGKVASGEYSKFLTNDVINDHRIHDHEWAKELSLVSFIGFRLLASDGSVLGVLALFSQKTISSEENAQLENLAGITAQVIQKTTSDEALLASQKEWEDIFQAIGHPTIIIDPNHNIIKANKSTRVAAGMSENDLKGKKCYDIFHNSKMPPESCPMKALIHSGSLETIEMEMEALDGTFLVSCTPVADENGGIKNIIHIATEITEMKRLECQAHHAQKMESIGMLAGGIAHDFNNMLAIISGNTSYLLNLYSDSEELVEVLTDIQDGTKRAQQLTQQLLTFSKGGAPLKKVTNINDLLKESTLFVLRGSNSTCNFNLSDDLWQVEVDSGQLNQVFSNIVINANQAMAGGGVITIRTENTKMKAQTEVPLPAGKYVKISFEDQGTGISEKNLANIFDPYFSTKSTGRGLGLATTYSIIDKHGGHITADSVLGEGTTFTIFLQASDKKIQSSDENVNIKHTGRGRILIMDDDVSILKMAGRMLKKMGYEYHVARDGKEAVETYQAKLNSQNPIDLVILDLTVPGGMGGQEAINQLLNIDPNIKAIVSSGYSSDPVMANYKAYGFCGVIPKPYSRDSVAEVLNEIFDDKA